MSTFRLLLLVDSLGDGGAETSLLDLSRTLTGAGVDVHLAWFGGRKDLRPQFATSGVSLHDLGASRSRWARIWQVRALCRRIKPHVLHTTLFEADVAGRLGARLAGTPVVSSIVNEMYTQRQETYAPSRLKLRLARLTDVVTIRLTSGVHAISSTVADVMSTQLFYPRDRIRVIYRGRGAGELGVRDEFRRRRVRESLGLSATQPVLLCVGRHEPQKGLDVVVTNMVKIISRHPDAVLLIAGREGEATAQLRELASQCGEGVRFLGSRRDVPDLLCAADVLAYPSRWEGLGGVLIEALALECPVVCSDLPVCREVMGNEAAVTYVNRESEVDWSVELGRVLQDARDENAVSRGRQRFLRQFESQIVASEMVNFYKESIKPRK